MPHADNPGDLAEGEFVTPEPQGVGGIYALRGTDDGKLLSLAKLLALTGPVPLVPPMPLELEDRGEVLEADREALMQWLAEELGESNVQTYLARAYPPSLNTDLGPSYRAIERFRDSATILKDPDGTQVAALGRVINESSTDVPMAPEFVDSITQTLALHAGDGTYHAAAGQWINALEDYTGILMSEMGWPRDRSVAFVTDKYLDKMIESGDMQTASFVRMFLRETFGS